MNACDLRLWRSAVFGDDGLAALRMALASGLAHSDYISIAGLGPAAAQDAALAFFPLGSHCSATLADLMSFFDSLSLFVELSPTYTRLSCIAVFVRALPRAWKAWWTHWADDRHEAAASRAALQALRTALRKHKHALSFLSMARANPAGTFARVARVMRLFGAVPERPQLEAPSAQPLVWTDTRPFKDVVPCSTRAQKKMVERMLRLPQPIAPCGVHKGATAGERERGMQQKELVTAGRGLHNLLDQLAFGKSAEVVVVVRRQYLCVCVCLVCF